MKKWYRSPLTKAVLVGTAIVTAAAITLSGILLLGYQGEGIVNSENLLGFQSGEYEESAAFSDRMKEFSRNILEQISAKKVLETPEGSYDAERLVDVMEYEETGKITGKNESGLAYTLGDLVSWVSADSIGEDVVVCEKPDGTYYYYYQDEFEKLLKDGTLNVEEPFEEEEETHDSDVMIEELINLLDNEMSPRDFYGTSITIQDKEGNVIYQDFWPFSQSLLTESAKPDGAENLLDVVNKTPEFNGKLSEVCDKLKNTLNRIGYLYNLYQNGGTAWEEGNTNFSYLFVDKEAKKVYTNREAFQEYEDAEANIESMKTNGGRYVIVKPKLADFESNINTSAADWRSLVDDYGEAKGDYVFAASVDTAYPIQDIFYTGANEYGRWAPYLQAAGTVIIAGVILLLTALIWLTIVTGRHPEDEEIHLNGFDRWKTALGAAAVIAPWFLMTAFLANTWNGIGYREVYAAGMGTHYTNTYYMFSMNTADIVIICLYAGLTMVLFLTGYLSLVRRIKGKTLWTNSVTRWICQIFRIFWRHRSVTMRGILLTGGFILIHWMVWLFNGYFTFIMLAADAAAMYFVICKAIEKDRIRKGIQEIASGNVNYQIPLEKMRGESKEMAELINNIGDGLNRAVDGAMKSERLKTDLITNVSHDIKTPLTSIINYVDLLKRENFEDPKIQGYLEILEAKSQRLKTLTEDVVEASKVSSGNITLEMMDVNLVEMVNQTIGEFSEKMDAKNLTVVATLPEEPAIVHVDGRRMWRVLENIFNNAAKYAMQGTRVYADLKVKDKKVQFSLKNVSENPLNINAEELTERFIRGDVSRSTEGSGLGLSIARDLTEMQGGTFTLYVDGDLFKVMIEF